jgi:hypothetical protein
MEATSQWGRGNSYYCSRLEALISPKYKWVETPRDDCGYNVMLLSTGDGGLQKFFKKDGVYYQDIFDGSKNRKVQAYLNDETKMKLINQEDFYKEKKYLK